MSYPFGITGIGNNPYMSGLGAYALPGGSSTYSSYYTPSFMGMGMGMTGMGMAGLGMPGMMGMYPEYMKQMNQVYQDMEKNQLTHAGAMHELLLQNKTNAYAAEDRALFEQVMTDSGLQTSIVNLAQKIREGDSDGVCEEYDKIKGTIYEKFNKYFKDNPNTDPAKSVRQVIENMYASIISQKSGEVVSLRSDIERFGETALMHGFNEKFFGKKDYHKKYTEETLSYLYGTRIDNKGGKDRMEKIGGIGGRAAEGAIVGAAGALTLPIAATAVKGVLSSITPSKISSKIAECSTFNKKFAWIGGLLALGADVVWQLSRD